MTENRTQTLKYLGIEMLKNDATKSSKPEVGLFRGLWERSNEADGQSKTIKLILLGTKDKENDLRALNLAVFNVLSVKMLYGDTKELIVFKNNEADQKEAIKILQKVLEEFQTEKRMVDNDPEIIDVATFENVPKEFFSVKETTQTQTAGGNYGYGGIGGCGYQDNDWKKKQQEREEKKALEDKLRQTPMIITRKTELPGVKALNAIKKKVLALAEGNYEGSLTDPDPSDTFKDGKKITAVK